MNLRPDLAAFAAKLVSSPALATLLRLGLEEDLGSGDVTTRLMVPAAARAEGVVRAKADGVFCGGVFVPELLRIADVDLRWQGEAAEGESVDRGRVVGRLRGGAADVLALERLLLNLLQRLCGIATRTRTFVRAVTGTDCRVLETRKTVPGWRLLDKYAVLAGGGTLHRLGLHDQILAKENHFRLAMAAGPGGFAGALERLMAARPAGMVVEVEVETLEQLDAALAAGVDIVLLDDMDEAAMREAVRRRDACASPAALEASGGITLERIAAVAATGVERISIGALTHSVPALDLSLDVEI